MNLFWILLIGFIFGDFLCDLYEIYIAFTGFIWIYITYIGFIPFFFSDLSFFYQHYVTIEHSGFSMI